MQPADHVRRSGVPPARNGDFNRFADAWKLEELRQVVRRELRTHRGQQSLARMAGVGRSVVRKLVEMRSVPVNANLDRLREWAADRPLAEAPLEAVCLALLVEELPANARYRVRLELAEALTRLHQEAGSEVPAWLVREIEDRRRHP